MISLKKGNLIEEKVCALVNTVNCVGIMGKGIALQFKQAYPQNYNLYKKACDHKEVRIGEMFVTYEEDAFAGKYIINFPTKVHWRQKSKLEYIAAGLQDLRKKIIELKIKSIAIPPLGCGNGGLNWQDVKPLIIENLEKLDINMVVFEPSEYPGSESMRINTKKPKMTIGRALLIQLLLQYKQVGYSLSLLEIQKLMYFLQEAGENLRLDFRKYQLGPYANNLNHVLISIDGHYIKGFGDRSRQSKIQVLPNAESQAINYIKANNIDTKSLSKVISLIDGFESPYGLELLSSVHWIVTKENVSDINSVKEKIFSWTVRKKNLFSEEHIQVAYSRLKHSSFI